MLYCVTGVEGHASLMLCYMCEDVTQVLCCVTCVRGSRKTYIVLHVSLTHLYFLRPANNRSCYKH